MSFRASLRRLASHAPRQPSMRFPDRSAAHPHHSPTPHPCAPSSIISSSTFLKSLQADQPSDVPLAGAAGGSAPGQGFDNGLPEPEYEEWNMPQWLQRNKYAPSQEEIDAVLSGGATAATEVTKAYKSKWWTPQV